MITTPPPIRLAPPLICNMERRMMIFVDEDNILYECTCEVLFKGFICRWQIIGGVDAVKTRRFLKTHPRSIRLYAKAVTA